MIGSEATGRLALTRPLLSWVAAGTAFVAVALLGAALSRFEEFLTVFAPLAAAAVTDVLILLAVALVGRTRQFRPLWWTLAAGFCVYFVAASLHWSWGRDLGLVGFIGLLVLGFPASLSLLAILIVESALRFPLADQLGVAAGVLCLLVLPYCQHFVLLPKLLTERQRGGDLQAPASTDAPAPDARG